MECYNPRMNEWSYVAKMNEPHYGHAGTVYGGLMYISGNFMGNDEIVVFCSVFAMIQTGDTHLYEAK